MVCPALPAFSATRMLQPKMMEPSGGINFDQQASHTRFWKIFALLRLPKLNGTLFGRKDGRMTHPWIRNKLAWPVIIVPSISARQATMEGPDDHALAMPAMCAAGMMAQAPSFDQCGLARGHNGGWWEKGTSPVMVGG